VQELGAKVAVVTGAASGIGRALARAFAAEGMKVALADVEEAPLAEAARELEARGAAALAVPTDVTRASDVLRLAQRTLEAFGAVHVVCNNAGVFTGGTTWEAPLEDYEWLLGVNVWGVIHGIRSFVPLLLEQGEGHVVNTASMAAVTTLPFTGIYHLTKHAVLALSESLYHELRARGARVGVTVLCPEMVATRIDASERNRPAALRREAPRTPEGELVAGGIADAVKRGIPPEAIARRALAAIREDRFYVLSDDAWRSMAATRCEDLKAGRNPTLSVPTAG
jgi:NAD(P)-dependent dehydrogenase (short-subunit alcohol dehydrogenase family)